MLNILCTATLLGLSAGFAPGPLLTLVISETMRHGTRAGVKVALAPLLTDLPIVALSVLILGKLAVFNPVMAAISFTGGIVIIFLGWQDLRSSGAVLNPAAPRADSLRKGIIVNFLSPYPYLFWLGVGAPLLLKAAAHGPGAALAFISTFYGLLLGSKLLLALLVGRSKTFLTGGSYLLILRGLGLLLILFGFFLFREGWLLLAK